MLQKNMNIVVLCGGTSTEREISIVSGTGVARALRQKGHRAVLLDVFFGDEEIDFMDAFPEIYDVDAAALKIKANDRYLAAADANPSRSFFGPNVRRICRLADIVFLALHGTNGEDGRIQAAFDLERIRYTGSGYISSALAMDKGLTKTMLEIQGIPTPRGGLVRRREGFVRPEDLGLSLPLVAKVACGGSSVGVYICRTLEEYAYALEQCFLLEPEVVVEEYIDGREFSVGVLDGKALPIIEIVPKVGFYDYKNKYTPGATEEYCPAPLPPHLTRQMQHLAEEGYLALYIEAYARFDFMMRPNGDMYCLEVNTLPGMTPTSLMPQEAAVEGMSYGDFCEKIIEVSLERYKRTGHAKNIE